MATTSVPNLDRPTSVPLPSTDRLESLRPSPVLTSKSAANSVVTTPSVGPRPKGMQLSARKAQIDVAADILAEEWADVFDKETGDTTNPWGNDDLMDVNADADDWSMHILYGQILVRNTN
jgi:SCY1-like protein 1